MSRNATKSADSAQTSVVFLHSLLFGHVLSTRGQRQVVQ
jgi:hypothetical protein